MSHDTHMHFLFSAGNFNLDGIYYVVAVVVCLLLLALIVSVTVCCVHHKKKGILVLQAQNSSYSDRNDEAINAGANGEIREVVEGDEHSDFDFDAVAEEAEMKVILFQFRTWILRTYTVMYIV